MSFLSFKSGKSIFETVASRKHYQVDFSGKNDAVELMNRKIFKCVDFSPVEYMGQDVES